MRDKPGSSLGVGPIAVTEAGFHRLLLDANARHVADQCERDRGDDANRIRLRGSDPGERDEHTAVGGVAHPLVRSGDNELLVRVDRDHPLEMVPPASKQTTVASRFRPWRSRPPPATIPRAGWRTSRPMARRVPLRARRLATPGSTRTCLDPVRDGAATGDLRLVEQEGHPARTTP